MTEAETTEFLKRYRRWRRYAWLRWGWWKARARKKAEFWECSFCKSHISKTSTEQGMLGVEDYICRDCIALCAEAMASHDLDWRDRLIESLHKADDSNKSS